MGVLDWMNGRKDEETIPLNDLDSSDGEAQTQKGRQGDGNIKRRRHQISSKGMFSGSREGQANCVDVAGEQTYFPGMVNLSGTLCYMNSVLQVRSSS